MVETKGDGLRFVLVFCVRVYFRAGWSGGDLCLGARARVCARVHVSVFAHYS